MTVKAEKLKTVTAYNDGTNYIARFKPALPPLKLDAVMSVAPHIKDYKASKAGRIKELVFGHDQFLPGLQGPNDFLQCLGSMAIRIKYDFVSETVEYRKNDEH